MSQRNFSFAIFFSLLGIGVGIGGVITGVALSPELPQQLLQYRGLAIVFGGLAAMLCTAFSLAEVFQSFGLLWDVLTGGAEPDREGLLKESVMLATRGRESEGQENKFYREIKPYLSHQLLQAGVELLIAGYSPEMLRNTLATRRDQENLKYQSAIQLLQSLMQAAWMLGIAGAAAALMRTQLLARPELLPYYFGGVAVPLVAGLLLALLLFFPLLRRLQVQQREWLNYLEMSICAVLLLQARHHAHYLETVLKAYLPPAAPAPPAMPSAPGLPPNMAPHTPAAAPAARSSFQAALSQEAEPELYEEPEDAGPTLSVNDLRRPRTVQKPRSPQAPQRASERPQERPDRGPAPPGRDNPRDGRRRP